MGQRGMGGVYKRAGSRYWWIRYSYRGHEYRESTKSFSRKEANRLLQTRLGAIASGEFQGPPQERLVMRELFNAFLSDYTLRGGLHVSKIQSQMRPLRRAFDREPLRDVTERRIDKYIEDRVQQGYAPATINHETQYLGQSLRLAYRRRQLSRVPAIRKLPVHNARQGFFERAEFEALMQHLPIAIADIARFAYLSGWRKGEITRLEWRDVDLDGGVIRLRPEHSKTWAGRVLPISDGLNEVVDRRLAERTMGQRIIPWVFHRSGKPVKDFRHIWTQACERAGLRGKLFHDLRRTAVRNIVRAGTPERIAMAISGHKTRAVFDRYNIVQEDDLRHALARTEDYLAQQPMHKTVETIEQS